MIESSSEEPLPVRVVSESIGEYIGRLGPVWVEGAVAIAHGDSHVTGSIVEDEIQFAVMVQISHGHHGGGARNQGRRLKGAVAVTQEEIAHGGLAGGYDEIGLAVTVHIERKGVADARVEQRAVIAFVVGRIDLVTRRPCEERTVVTVIVDRRFERAIG